MYSRVHVCITSNLKFKSDGNNLRQNEQSVWLTGIHTSLQHHRFYGSVYSHAISIIYCHHLNKNLTTTIPKDTDIPCMFIGKLKPKTNLGDIENRQYDHVIPSS